VGQGFQAAKLRLKCRFAKAEPTESLAKPEPLRISASAAWKPSFRTIGAVEQEKFFASKFALN
jgi:predicted component of type VI protein secretion system